jgi:hypothetical protein
MIMRRTLGTLAVLIPILTLFLLGCGDNGSPPVRSTDLFPLAVGNTWDYTGGKSDTITARELIDGSAYHQFNPESIFGGSGLVRLNDLNQLTLLVRCCGETVLFDFGAQPGDRWVFEDCTDGPLIEIALLDDDEAIVVPAGRFTGCHRFAFWGIQYVLCPGIGLVSAEDQAATNSYELVSYALKDPEPGPADPPPNMLVNGSFERFCCPGFFGWSIGNRALTSSTEDTPENGGCWSARLTADWAPTTAILRQRVEGVVDGDVLRLSAQVRAADSEGGGRIGLVVGDRPWMGEGKWASTSDTLWTELSLVDTLSLEAGDSVWVELSSFHTEIVPRVGLFDSVVLERVVD